MAEAVLVNGFENGGGDLQISMSANVNAGGDGFMTHERMDMSPTSPDVGNDLQMVLGSQPFRDEVQAMIAQQMKVDSLPAANVPLPYAARVFGPVTAIGDIHGVDTLNYTKDEKVTRAKVASCYRLADINGWSHGLDGYISARLSAENSLLMAPYGLMFDEVTASSLVKVDMQGQLVDDGSTMFGVDSTAVSLHVAAYSASSSIMCVIHISSPAVLSVSTMKCGLMPVCYEAMSVGEVAYSEYTGGGPDDAANVQQALSSNAKVVFLRNYGVLVTGETVEEAFLTAVNVVAAVDTQLSLVPFGLDNVHLPSAESQQEAYKMARQLPVGVSSVRQWCYGELEFDCLMRQLDNAGYRTGHIYRDAVTGQRYTRSVSDADIAVKKLALANDATALSLPRPGSRASSRASSRADWCVTPNAYHREEMDDPNSNRKVTRWVSDSGRPYQRASSLKVDANRFAPQGANPNELRDKIKEIRKEYYTDLITAGPQSTVLEGVTWEEAQRIKEGQSIGGVDNVLVTAASRGIIQREHWRGALFYKNYSLGNPFDNVTKDDLDAYRKEVERKEKRRAGGFMSADGELEDRGVVDNRPFSAPPPKLSFTTTRQTDTFPADVTGASHVTSRDTEDEVFRDQSRPPTQASDAERLQSPSSPTAEISKEASPPREASEGGTLPKDKKKKRGFRLPSFSKKKEK